MLKLVKLVLIVVWVFVFSQTIFAEKPNILFILADDVGQEVLGCYGGQSYPTPNLDALARSGQQYLHCYSMPVCHPSRLTLLCGRYPRDLGQPSWGTFPKKFEKKTFAHALKQAGYETAIAGKWQLTLLEKDPNHPHRLGFDRSCLFGWHEGARYHNPLIWQNGERQTNNETAFGPDLYTDFLIDFMSSTKQPFFAFYSMALCHDVSDDLDNPPPYPFGKDRYLSYAEMVEAMDRQIGKLISAIKRLGLEKSTYIIFTSDNGTASRSITKAQRRSGSWHYHREAVWSEKGGTLLRGGKGRLEDSGTRVPLIVNRQAKIKPSIVKDLIDFSDFLPTFCALAKSDLPDWNLRGMSFANRILGNESASRRFAFSEKGERFWLRTLRWKLFNDGAFYDLQKDPTEENDLQNLINLSGDALSEKARETHKMLSRILGEHFSNP